ncbi:MAG: hypothetical protein QOG86_1344 [Thermoleophilaceae bacterium]|nr:hypothetical protein [Thermoleophilaceae bacterium]
MYGVGSAGVVVAVAASVLLLAAPTGEADHASSGGASYVAQPKIDSVKCTARCVSHGRVRNGGTVRLRGGGLASTRQVVFMGDRGKADDRAVTVAPAGDHVLAVKVPYGAGSGPVSAWASSKARSHPSKRLGIVPAPAPDESGRLTPASGPAEQGAPALETAVNSGLAFADGRHVRFTFRIDDKAPAGVVVRVVEVSTGTVVRTWSRKAVGPHKLQTFSWNTRNHGGDAPDGRYAFRMTATGASGAVAKNASDGDDERDAFDLHGYSFPLRAHHTYGDGFGAPRAGHRHQGQDVFASCGVPMFAARGGTVKDNKYQYAAGNYVVIDGAGTGYDFFYAHLRKASPLKVGSHVVTGQRIGSVGDTGDAVGCHLHFEMWSAPGWYSGGHAFDPLRFLKAWDRYS